MKSNENKQQKQVQKQNFLFKIPAKNQSTESYSDYSSDDSYESEQTNQQTMQMQYTHLLNNYRLLYKNYKAKQMLVQRAQQRIKDNMQIIQQTYIKNKEREQELQLQEKICNDFKPQKLIFNQKIEDLRVAIEQSQPGTQNVQFDDNLALTQLQQSINIVKSQKQQFIINNQIIEMYKLLTGLQVSPNAQNYQQFQQYQQQVVEATDNMSIKDKCFVFSIGNPEDRSNYAAVIKYLDDHYYINYLRRSEIEDYNQEFELEEKQVKELVDQINVNLSK